MKRRILLYFLCVNFSCLVSQNLIRTKDKAHEGGITALTVSEDGALFLTGGMDAKSFLWNARTGEKLRGALKHNDRVSAVALSSNNRLYATGSPDFKVRVLDIESGVPIRILSEHTAEITALAYNPITNFLASAAKDKSIKIWDNSKNKVSLLTLTGHEKDITDLEYSADGKLLFSASLDNTIKIWDATTGEIIQTIEAQSGGLTSLALSSDQTLFASGGVNGLLTIWDFDKRTKLIEIKGYKSQINSISLSGDKRFIAVAGNSKVIQIYNISTGKLEKEIAAHDMDITGIGFCNKGTQLVSASKDGSLKVWDVSVLKVGKKSFVKPAETPQLVASSLSLKDENSNGIIDGGEKSSLVFTIKNSGKSNAYNLYAKVASDQVITGFDFEKEMYLGHLGSGQSQNYTIPLSATGDVQSANGSFTVSFDEANDTKINPLNLSFQVGGATNYSYIMVMGQSFSSATGKAQIGAPITLTLKIKNIAKTEAKNIKVNFLLPENVKAVNKLSEVVPSIAGGEMKDIQMDFFAEPSFKLAEIKMGIDIEGAAFTNAKEIIIKLKMNETLPGGEDYSGQVAVQATQINEQNTTSESSPLYRGGGSPMKGLNVNKPKEMVIGNYYALLIGIDKYKGAWPQLINAVNDAKAIEKTLKLSYKFDNFKTLYNEQANREAIIRELEWLVANAKEIDNVFIYYSGHGEYKKELSKGYWVPVDAETQSTSKYISNSDIQTYINGIKSKHTLLVSDACFSGDIFRGNTLSVPFEESEKYYREVHGLPSRQAFTSGGIEPVMDGGKDGHSVFAYYFLKSLEANQEKYMDISQIYTKIKIPVINNSEQTPKLSPIKNSGDEGGQFIFIKK
ncbi:MAG: caspase family protein [bacterium]|nr:caspase family protein [bacterium]